MVGLLAYQNICRGDQWSPVDFHANRKRTSFRMSFVLALPIFTARPQATIVGVSELNFCVRDGNRWTLTTINTNSHRMAFNHPLYKLLQGYLLVTHTGFEPMLTA